MVVDNHFLTYSLFMVYSECLQSDRPRYIHSDIHPVATMLNFRNPVEFQSRISSRLPAPENGLVTVICLDAG